MDIPGRAPTRTRRGSTSTTSSRRTSRCRRRPIRHSQTLANDAGTILWVDPKASVTHSTTQSQEVQADFLTGGIAQQHLATAAAAGGGAAGVLPTPPIHLSQLAPCITQLLGCGFTRQVHCWVTELCPPSRFVHCPSFGFTCTFVPPCGVLSHTPPCQVVSAVQPCHSIGIACTVAPPCFQTGFVCPSQLRCPSGPVCGGPVLDPLSPIAR